MFAKEGKNLSFNYSDFKLSCNVLCLKEEITKCLKGLADQTLATSITKVLQTMLTYSEELGLFPSFSPAR